jgi:hypothetical protein
VRGVEDGDKRFLAEASPPWGIRSNNSIHQLRFYHPRSPREDVSRPAQVKDSLYFIFTLISLRQQPSSEPQLYHPSVLPKSNPYDAQYCAPSPHQIARIGSDGSVWQEQSTSGTTRGYMDFSIELLFVDQYEGLVGDKGLLHAHAIPMPAMERDEISHVILVVWVGFEPVLGDESIGRWECRCIHH